MIIHVVTRIFSVFFGGGWGVYIHFYSYFTHLLAGPGDIRHENSVRNAAEHL